MILPGLPFYIEKALLRYSFLCNINISVAALGDWYRGPTYGRTFCRSLRFLIKFLPNLLTFSQL